ncbi:MAG: cardiolipin synthase [Bacteroidales bacterium]|nr:cardiolipin synthase [Bacteroidales bacterium]
MNFLSFASQHYLLGTIFALIYIGILLTILMENRNPSKSLAYILVLIFVPVLGLVIYYFFGQDLRKKKIFQKKVFKEVDIYNEYIENYFQDSEEALRHIESELGSLALPFRQMFNQGQSLPSIGNKVKLLNNGEEKFPALFEALETAKHHIHVDYYIFSNDDIGIEFTNILVRKAAEGVIIRVIVDDRGSRKIKDIPKILKNAGIEFYRFMPVQFSSLAQANYRNHKKIVIIDGKIGFIGGINMDDRYLNNGKYKLFWRDTHVKIQGLAVRELQYDFFKSLSFVSKKQYKLEPVYFPELDDIQGDANISVISSGPASPNPYNMEAIVTAINQAKQSVKITNPYFIPSEQILMALELAAISGVEVELIIPAKSDSYIVLHSSFSYLKPLMKRGVKVYLYKKGFVHAKTVQIDDKLAFVGTVNMDIRSFYINFEIAAMIQDIKLCEQMKEQFEIDKNDSVLVDAEGWLQRPKYKKFIDSVCRLLTPLL